MPGLSTRSMAALRAAAPARAAVLALAAISVLTGCAASSFDPGPAGHRIAGRHSGGNLSAVLAGLSRPASGPAYYLSLGDSLSRGIQPAPAGGDVPTSRGYPDQLAGLLRGALPGLRLVKLGCSGETTFTMIHGGICRYPAGSQLAQAGRFLQAHQGSVALVTIDIGANDPNSCITGARPRTMLGCLSGRITQTKANLNSILAVLRFAAGRRVLIVGMTYYVPELGLWGTGRTGREIAVVTDDLAAGVNRLLTAGYHRYGARVANVFGAFRSADFSGVSGRSGTARLATTTPPNVAAICALTWMCAPRPRGPNEHANDAGYHLIARTFWQAITG